MESPTMPEYESSDCDVRPDKTQMARLKHNGSVDLETENFSFERQTRAPEAREPAANMANDLLIQSDTESQAATAIKDGAELDLTFGVPVEEAPIWANLYESIRDVFFPPQLPPLKLTSTPIPVPDRMAVKPNPWAFGIATTVNVAIVIFLLFIGVKTYINNKATLNLTATDIDVGEYKAPKAATRAGGGGGGGDHSMVDPSKGKLPKFEKNPPLAPQVQALDHPKLAMESAINVQKDIILPDNPNLPNIGVKNSINVKLASNGQGGGGGMGTGYGGGMGSGSGNGYGRGSGGNTGGGLYHIGGSVSAPVVLYEPEAEFSDEARRAKYQGVVLVSIIVDAQGHPQNARVLRALGMGLDEKALEAVMKYRFKPAMKDGRTPVPVPMNVEINFHLY